jgi:hypothetical protein
LGCDFREGREAICSRGLSGYMVFVVLNWSICVLSQTISLPSIIHNLRSIIVANLFEHKFNLIDSFLEDIGLGIDLSGYFADTFHNSAFESAPISVRYLVY